jgi:hypothetical protein
MAVPSLLSSFPPSVLSSFPRPNKEVMIGRGRRPAERLFLRLERLGARVNQGEVTRTLPHTATAEPEKEQEERSPNKTSCSLPTPT